VAKFRATERLELIHADLCGPITPATPGGKRYFLLMVDDLSRYMWLVLLSTKDEAEAAIRRIKAAAEVQSGCTLRTLRTDRGGEFTSRSFEEFCADTGVQRHLSAPYTPQHNGVVERRNQTVVATARSMLKGRGVPNTFWGEAVTTAVFLLNRSFTRAVDDKTPYELWHGKTPNLHFLRVFGCVVHVKAARPHLKKLEDRSRKMVLLGYEPGSKAYKVFDPLTQTVHVTRDAVFDEAASWSWENGGLEAVNSDFDVEYTLPQAAAPRGSAANPPTPERALDAHGATTPAPERAQSAHGTASPQTPATPQFHDAGDPQEPFRGVRDALQR
jgi:transposase InsO family protein